MRFATILLALSLYPSALPAQTVIAHRGGKAQAPENTMAAFRTAIANGVKVLELDVVLSKDGHLIVHHDLEINPQICHGTSGTPVRGPISLLTLKQLWTLDCGDSHYPGQRLPVLEEVLELAQHAQVTLMIETKMAQDSQPSFVPPATVVAALHAAIQRYQLAPRVWLQSFDHRTLAAMRQRNPAIKRILLNPRTRLDDYLTPARQLDAFAQFINFRILEKRDVDALHAAGFQVFSGTTSDPAEWKKLQALGVDAILTDDPVGLLALTR